MKPKEPQKSSTQITQKSSIVYGILALLQVLVFIWQMVWLKTVNIYVFSLIGYFLFVSIAFFTRQPWVRKLALLTAVILILVTLRNLSKHILSTGGFVGAIIYLYVWKTGGHKAVVNGKEFFRENIKNYALLILFLMLLVLAIKLSFDTLLATF